MEKELLKIIKPKCDKCAYQTEVFGYLGSARFTKKCSKSKCEYEQIVNKISMYLEENYNIKPKIEKPSLFSQIYKFLSKSL